MGSASEESREEAYRTVSGALKAGYRYIDTADGYNNEEMVSKAIKVSGPCFILDPFFGLSVPTKFKGLE